MATGVNTRKGSRRLLEFAFEHAIATGRKKVTIVHKANIMKALTGIFLETAQVLHARKYKGRIAMDSVIIDACAMKLVLNPWQFDVPGDDQPVRRHPVRPGRGPRWAGSAWRPGANIGADAAIFERCTARRRHRGQGHRQPHGAACWPRR
jgi:isocitrate dehydrogenase (NAD+)